MTRVPLLSTVGGAAGAVAAYSVERAVVGRVRARDGRVDAEPLALPAGTVERHVPTHDGGSVRVLERGDQDAQPIVFLHGITLAADVWTYQLDALSPRFRVVALDLRGHGASAPGADGYGLGAMAADVATVLRELDLRNAVVVGHSMGGMVLMRAIGDYAALFRERVAGCVLLSTSPGLALPSPVHAALVSVGDAVLGLMARAQWRVPWYGFPSNDLSYVVTRLAFGRRPASEHVEATRAWVAATPVETSMRCGFAMSEHAARRVLRDADVRALVVVGSADKLTPPRLARRLVKLLPGTPLEIIPGAGHQAMLERPTDLAKLLTTFADEVA